MHIIEYYAVVAFKSGKCCMHTKGGHYANWHLSETDLNNDQ